MKLKNTIHLNRIPQSYDILSDFEKARQYHLKHGVEWENTFRNVSVVGYLNSLYGNKWFLMNTEKLIKLEDTDVNTFVFDMAEWANPTGSMYPLKKETPNGCTYLVGNKPYTTIGTFPSEHESGQTWIQIAHEGMHDIVKIANLQGFNVPDVMDSYKENSNPDSPTGNFTQQWKLLEPFLMAQNAPRVPLTRLYDWGDETVGKLEYRTFTCNTLERGYKENKQNISAIPKGEYRCKWTFSPKFMKYTYEVQGVPNRSGIRIHSASFWSDLLGCIALGKGYANLNTDGKPDLLNSRATVKSFEDLMGRKEFLLVIK